MEKSHYDGLSRTTLGRKKKKFFQTLLQKSNVKNDEQKSTDGSPFENPQDDIEFQRAFQNSNAMEQGKDDPVNLGLVGHYNDARKDCATAGVDSDESNFDGTSTGISSVYDLSAFTEHSLRNPESSLEEDNISDGREQTIPDPAYIGNSSKERELTSNSSVASLGYLQVSINDSSTSLVSSSDLNSCESSSVSSRCDMSISSLSSPIEDLCHESDTSMSSAGGSTSDETSSQSEDFESTKNTSELLSDLEGSFVAYFLEPEPPRARHDPDDPDPDDDSSGGSDDNSGSDDSSSDSDDDDILPANINNEELGVPLALGGNLTKGNMILLNLAQAMRHHWTFEALLDNFHCLNVPFGHNFFPTSKNKLWRQIHLNKAGVQMHVYCSKRSCGQYIGRKDKIRGNFANCRCGHRVPLAKASFFVTLNLADQLKRFLEIPGMWNKLQYRETRQKASPTSVEDIFDGSYYRSLQEEGGPLSYPHNFSYVFNTDGCTPTKKGKLKIWPIFIWLNELPPELRQQFTFLAAVFIDKWEPNFNSYFKPFVKQANKLSNDGIIWKPDGINEVTSKFIPLCHCVDADARNKLPNMAKFNSHFGCTYCTHYGVYMGGSMRYPATPHPEIPPHENRTHQGMVDAMIEAHENGNVVVGHKGLSQILLLDHHDLREGQGADDLHPDHEGCTNDLTDLLFTLAPRIVNNMPNNELERLIDQRLLCIKTPSRLSRKPASITSRGSFKGSEWRNWLFFYGIPCMSGLISEEYLNLFYLLSHALYLLSQDVIEPADIATAQRYLRRYAVLFEQKFGVERCKYNTHGTTSHKVNSVQKLGPPWCSSTYNFESLNGKVVKNITSPKGAIMQMVTRFLLHQTVYMSLYDERISESVRQCIQHIVNKERLLGAREVGQHMYVVGNAINRPPTADESEVLRREGFNVHVLDEYKSCIIGSTRYKSVLGQNEDIRSDDTFVYTWDKTFCTIHSIVEFQKDNGEDQFGMFVIEHAVARVLPIARHISVLEQRDGDLQYFLSMDRVRSPAVKMEVNGLVYAAPLPNCFEID